MIVPDVNLLVYAHDLQAPGHPTARQWWESTLNSPVRVGLAWVVALGFIRVTTHPSILKNPLTVREATERISSWLLCANVGWLEALSRSLGPAPANARDARSGRYFND